MSVRLYDLGVECVEHQREKIKMFAWPIAAWKCYIPNSLSPDINILEKMVLMLVSRCLAETKGDIRAILCDQIGMNSELVKNVIDTCIEKYMDKRHSKLVLNENAKKLLASVNDGISLKADKELELDVAVEEKLEVAFELPNCSTADFSWENVADFMRVDGNNAIFCRKPSPIERNNIYTLCQKPQAIVRQMSADRRTSYKNTLRIWREWVDFVLSSTCLRNPGQKSLAIKPYFIASEADKKRILELSDMLFEEADENNRTAFLLPTEWINYREVDDSRVLRRLLNFGDSFDEVDEDDLKNYRLSVLPVTQTDVGSIQRLMKLISLQRSVLMMEWQSEQQTKCPICQEDNIHRTAQNSWKCDNLSCGVEWGKTRCTTKCKEWFYWIQPGSDMVKKLRFQDVQCDTPCEAI